MNDKPHTGWHMSLTYASTHQCYTYGNRWVIMIGLQHWGNTAMGLTLMHGVVRLEMYVIVWTPWQAYCLVGACSMLNICIENHHFWCEQSDWYYISTHARTITSRDHIIIIVRARVWHAYVNRKCNCLIVNNYICAIFAIGQTFNDMLSATCR